MPFHRDTANFLTVIELNKGIIYKVANAYCKNSENRKDLVQEIAVQLWQAFPNYNNQFKLTTWVYRIALNVSISFYRKESRYGRRHNPLTDDIIGLITEDEQLDLESDLSMLHNFIRELKEFDRAVILLYLEAHSQQEIADILGITPSNVSTRIARIKQQLKQKFASSKYQ
ncbi:RNA polymerase sigma factor [Dyadobacter psychrophilus]|uniref:RNA polymerase sigma-70 factor, ECF subfamily n=1 Tax=Dyadobacter psychrophilus TaxID=651661 RepID=A0A1T5DFG0_9BACT|nr:sigma-70 family RNA polymerase sigma factor [Dyadobacter psychrophilus]SKB70337.1 RNA polymerase sigma-70 factor, ECF subfamily [Dyadobacter psychrophilus]